MSTFIACRQGVQRAVVEEQCDLRARMACVIKRKALTKLFFVVSDSSSRETGWTSCKVSPVSVGLVHVCMVLCVCLWVCFCFAFVCFCVYVSLCECVGVCHACRCACMCMCTYVCVYVDANVCMCITAYIVQQRYLIKKIFSVENCA